MDDVTRYPLLGVGAILIDGGRILLIKRGKAPYQGAWSLPGGTVEWAEPMAVALAREVLEETGLKIEVGPIAGTFESISPEGSYHYVIVDLTATVVGGTLQAGDDAAEVEWVPIDELGSRNLTPRLVELLTGFGVLGQPD